MPVVAAGRACPEDDGVALCQDGIVARTHSCAHPASADWPATGWRRPALGNFCSVQKPGMTLVRLFPGLSARTGCSTKARSSRREPEPAPEGEEHIQWRKFPLSEMYRRGWLEPDENELEARADEILRDFFQAAGSLEMLRAFYRRTQHSLRSARKVNLYALTA